MKYMCKYCDKNSDKCIIFLNSFTHKYYVDLQTDQWDRYHGGLLHHWEYVNFCPWCGRDLYERKE